MPPLTGSWDDWLVTILASDPSLAPVPSYDDSFSYDGLGNLISKDGVVQQYGSNGNGTGIRPHAASTVAGQPYSYDNTGNLLSGGGRSLSWNAENQPTQGVVSGGVTEHYSYDADGHRVTRSVTPGVSTRYAFGLYELEGSITRSFYALAGQVVAVRDSGLGLSYLYGDHLGSISASTSTTGQRQGVQYFDAWGKKLTGIVSQTKRSFTGQYLDDTGLLFYNARYYDPGIGRFVSADSIVPGAGSLTVTPSDAVATPAWMQTGAAENPQELNRYSYVNNNPVGAGDPTGHCITCIGTALGALVGGGLYIATQMHSGGLDLRQGDQMKGFAVAMLTGAAAGAALATPGLQQVGLGMASNLLADHAGNLVGGERFNAADNLTSAVTGALGDGIAGKLDIAMAPISKELAKAAPTAIEHVAKAMTVGSISGGINVAGNAMSARVQGQAYTTGMADFVSHAITPSLTEGIGTILPKRLKTPINPWASKKAMRWHEALADIIAQQGTAAGARAAGPR